MGLGVSILSSFINNTPIVAMLLPLVYDGGKKRNIAPSLLLIPLSYITVLG
jgi:Na+/H+ antiporter NhaD/arsenite permease-like protein